MQCNAPSETGHLSRLFCSGVMGEVGQIMQSSLQCLHLDPLAGPAAKLSLCCEALSSI